MTAPNFSISRRSARVATTFATIFTIAFGLMVLIQPNGVAQAAPGEKVELGASNAKRIPLCPARCSGLAVVSGFQAKAGGAGHAYRVPFIGNITSWRLTLGKPNRSQRTFFEQNFGARPEAAIGVLAKRVVGGKVTYKLRYRSKIQGLNQYLGKTTNFEFEKPLKVNKGDYVSLIVPTWAPALSEPPACEIVKKKMRRPAVCAAFQKNNNWVASRDRSTCLKAPSKETSQAQIRVNSLASYGCRFNGVLTYGVSIESR